ncbi:MAG TPA: hypothetical protein DEV93_10100 [Chloroflexi bacterium]|jgi:hypothetical protein|nr:hypothetical protein [Chloroflexota bacterium]
MLTTRGALTCWPITSKAILALSASFHYAAAFGVARTALEHHMLDRLLFLATRWISVSRIKPQDVAAEDKRLTALQATSRPDIVKWWYDPKANFMKLLIRGVFREGSLGRGMTVSPYFFHVDRYDPFVVKARLAPRVATGFRDPASDKRWAEQSETDWYRLFTFRRLLENLVINRLLPTRELIQVEVHHSFLSAYVHGIQKAYELAYGHRRGPNLGAFDHYDSELCLLYAIALAAAELEAFGRMARRQPRLHLREWPNVEREIQAARAAASHFWFMSGGPHLYDRIQEIDTRIPITPGSKPPWARKIKDPSTLKPASVRYYLNPLRRLIRLHWSYQEMTTRIAFASPFPRADALQRSMD